MPKVQNAKLFVGGLSPITSEQDLKEYFSKFGGIETIRLKTDPNTGNSKGFAFIVFNSEKSVNDVMSVNEHMIKNKKVDIEKAKVKQGKLFVAGLTSDLTDNDIRNHFSSYGKIVHADFPIDKTKNIRKTFCFITFETEKSVHDIIKNPKHMIKNQEVNVQQKNNRYNVNGGFQVKGFNDIINRGRQFNNTQTNNRHSSFQNNSMNHGQYLKTDMSQESYQNNDMNQGQYQNNGMNQGRDQNNSMNQGQYQNNDMNQGRYQNNGMNQDRYQNNGMNQGRDQYNGMNQGQYQNNDMNQGRDQNNSINQGQYQNNNINQGRYQNSGMNQGQYQNNGMNQGQYSNNGMNKGRYQNNGMHQRQNQSNSGHGKWQTQRFQREMPY